MFLIYKSEYNPSNLTGMVGGNISSAELSGYLGELFYTVSAPPSGTTSTAYQYRKVFIKSTYESNATETKVWLDAVEHSEQISICLCSGLADYSSTPTGQPPSITGWTVPTTYANGLSLGTMAPNSYTGVWIRQSLSGIVNADPYATFRFYVGGIIE